MLLVINIVIANTVKVLQIHIFLILCWPNIGSNCDCDVAQIHKSKLVAILIYCAALVYMCVGLFVGFGGCRFSAGCCSLTEVIDWNKSLIRMSEDVCAFLLSLLRLGMCLPELQNSKMLLKYSSCLGKQTWTRTHCIIAVRKTVPRLGEMNNLHFSFAFS